MTEYTFVTIKERPDLHDEIGDVANRSWPELMMHDPIGGQYWADLYEIFPEFQFAMIETDSNHVIAAGNSLPLTWHGAPQDLPDQGWEWALEKGFKDYQAGVNPNVQCALSIPIAPEYRGKGLSKFVVQKMKSIGVEHGLGELIAPVRPNLKSNYPFVPIEQYVEWKDANGQPFDAWMRVHTRLGAEMIKVCYQSMTVSGSVNDWECWTDLKFSTSGLYAVPGALVPVKIDIERDLGIYIEPNVWMIHPLP